jgi:hypothetical protein
VPQPLSIEGVKANGIVRGYHGRERNDGVPCRLELSAELLYVTLNFGFGRGVLLLAHGVHRLCHVAVNPQLSSISAPTAWKVLIAASIFGLAAKQGQAPSETATHVTRKRFMRQPPLHGTAQLFQEDAEAMAFRVPMATGFTALFLALDKDTADLT